MWWQMGRQTFGDCGLPARICFPLGPCVLEYTKTKMANHFWTDPSAGELIQRHQDHSTHQRQNPATKRPALCVSGVDGEVLWGVRLRSGLGPGGKEWSGALKVTPGHILHLPAQLPDPEETLDWQHGELAIPLRP